jgi:hypothetical protein
MIEAQGEKINSVSLSKVLILLYGTWTDSAGRK